MITRRRVLNVFFTGAALGVVFAAVRVFWKFTAPPPRWDLIVPLTFSAVSLAAAWLILRRGSVIARQGERTSRYSWSSRRGLMVFAGAWFIPFAAYMLSFAGVSYSAHSWEIRDAGGVIRSVAVREVLSSDWHSGKNSYYIVRARADIPYSSGMRPQVGRFRAGWDVETGDTIAALYAPSSPDLGAVLGANRSLLEEEIGGSANGMAFFAAATVLAFVGFAFVLAGFSRPGTILKKHGEPGRLRKESFTVIRGGVHQMPDGKGKGGVACEPALFLSGSNGKVVTLRIDQPVDPIDAANLLSKQEVSLYWAPAEQNTKRRPPEHRAVLVAPEGRCLEGSIYAEESSLPEGTAVPAGKYLPEASDLRWIRTSPVWDSALHMVGLRWVLFGALCLIATGCGFNTFVTLVSAVAAACAPYIAAAAVKRKRQAYLRSLAPDAALPEVPA